MDEVNVIAFDEEGNVGIIEKEWELDASADFSYRYLLNEWANRQYDFVIGSNGICTENFLVDIPWQVNRDHYASKHVYWWGEDLIKKIHKHRGDYICTGACPFVYTKEIYTRPNIEPYLQAIFLPKTDKVTNADFPVETQLNIDYEKRVKLQETIYNLDWVNPIFICAPYDVDYYADMFPEGRLFSLGAERADIEWNARLLSVIQHCDTLYFQMVSTPAVYSSYVGREVKFYDTDVLHVENDDDELYTLDKTKKSDEYFKFLEYIHAVFETRSQDMDFWIRKFLSLDRIQTPEELAKTLQKSRRYGNPSLIEKPQVNDIILGDEAYNHHNVYPLLKQHAAQFNRKPSDDAVYYYNLL